LRTNELARLVKSLIDETGLGQRLFLIVCDAIIPGGIASDVIIDIEVQFHFFATPPKLNGESDKDCQSPEKK
jgi:hypothetical protein